MTTTAPIVDARVVGAAVAVVCSVARRFCGPHDIRTPTPTPTPCGVELFAVWQVVAFVTTGHREPWRVEADA
ncbi:MAG TPA: hypothetical protein VGF99_05960 [Myxococcota bacterium]